MFAAGYAAVRGGEQTCSTSPFSKKANKYGHFSVVITGFVTPRGTIGTRPPSCPRAYCRCGASLYLFGKIIPSLNLAANWLRKFPRALPAPGMVAARRGLLMIQIPVAVKPGCIPDPLRGFRSWIREGHGWRHNKFGRSVVRGSRHSPRLQTSLPDLAAVIKFAAAFFGLTVSS